MDSEKLLQIMKKKGYNTSKIATESGLSISTVNKIIYGVTKNPTLDNVQAIVKVLGVTLDEVFNDDVTGPHFIDPEAEALAEELHKNPEYRMLFSAAKGATKKDLELAAETLKRMKKDSGYD